MTCLMSVFPVVELLGTTVKSVNQLAVQCATISGISTLDVEITLQR